MELFRMNEAELSQLGANITTPEIRQQPELWEETLSLYSAHREEIAAFLGQILKKHGHIQVIFSGSGTSSYAGDLVETYLNRVCDSSSFIFHNIPATSLVAAPYDYLKKDQPILMVSFARSGNSPESLAAVNLGKEMVDHFYQIAITCAPEGQLAKQTEHDQNALTLFTPSQSNDGGFAMTGSFSCISLYALLIFDPMTLSKKEETVKKIVEMGKESIGWESRIDQLVQKGANRIVYVGSGPLAALTREAQLKVLELTAGKVATLFDSSMGLRHGPKSFINSETFLFSFLSNQPYTRQYDLDLLQEVKEDGIAKLTCAIGISASDDFTGENFSYSSGDPSLPDVYCALPYVVIAQTVAIHFSVAIGNKPDTPSPTGTVNRVVKGVTIHSYPQK